MTGLLRSTRILFTAHLARTLWSRRALVCLGLALVPVGACLLIARVAREVGPPPIALGVAVGWFLELQVIAPLIALIAGSAVVAEEIEDRTITFLFTRPIPRAAILFGRWLGALVLVLVLIALGTGLSSLILARILERAPDEPALPPGFWSRLIAVALLAGVVYSALFASLGALTKRPILVGLAYTFVVELFLGNLPGGNQKLTVQYYLKSALLAGYAELAEPVQRALIPVQLASGAEAVRTLLLILFAALALGAWRLSRREYVLSA